MPVDTPHAEYTALARVWRMIRDCIGGSRFIKGGAQTYLPILAEQNPQDYQAYRDRALFFNATQQTAKGFHGLIYAKPPMIDSPSKLDAIMKDATLGGTSFLDYCKDVVREQVTVSRGGSLIDFDPDENRTFVSLYKAENILNWKTMRIKGQMMLSLLVLFEYDPQYIPMTANAPQTPDEFDSTQYEQWRVYKLNDDGNGGGYVTCEIWRRVQTAKKINLPGTGGPAMATNSFKKIDEITPTRRSKTLQQIPFVFHGSENGLPDCNKPLMEDLSEVNVSHYRTSADLENALHTLGVPTPYVTGHTAGEDDDEIQLGSTRALIFSNADAKVGFLALKDDLNSLRTAMQDKQEQMAALGARMLEPQKKAVEAAETHRLRQTSQTSTLTNISLVGSSTLTMVLKWLYWWMSTEDSPAQIDDKLCLVKLNEEFIDSSVDPILFQNMLAALSAGKISYEVWFNWLQKGEIIGPDVSMEEEQAAIQEHINMPTPMPVMPPGALPPPGKPGKGRKGKNPPAPAPQPPPTPAPPNPPPGS